MSEIARWTDDGVLILETHAARVHVALRDLAAADEHRIDCIFSLGLQAVDRPADRRMLEEVFRAGAVAGALHAEEVCAHLKSVLLVAAKREIAKRDGISWLEEPVRKDLHDLLIGAARAATFTCGIKAVAPFQTDLSSPTLEQHRLSEMRQRLADQHVASRRERMQQSAEVLSQFVQLRAQAPDIPAGKLLDQIDASNPGGLLETLLIASAGQSRQPQTLWIVAGNDLIALSSEDASVQRLFALPTGIGPLRSVTRDQVEGRSALLVGARSGVIVVYPDAPDAPPLVFRDDQIQSQLGFNRAVIWKGRVHATHGEANLVSWDFNEPTALAARLLPIRPGHPRHLVRLDDDRFIYSSKRDVVISDGVDAGQVHTLPAEVVDILPVDRAVLIITTDGGVHRWDRATLAPLAVTRHARSITAAALLPWLDEPRLLLATDDGPIVCAGLHDSVTTQYLSPHRGLRAVAANQRAIVALTADRQRLIFWDAWNGRSPISELHAAQRFNHRVADLCFA